MLLALAERIRGTGRRPRRRQVETVERGIGTSLATALPPQRMTRRAGDGRPRAMAAARPRWRGSLRNITRTLENLNDISHSALAYLTVRKACLGSRVVHALEDQLPSAEQPENSAET